MINHIHGIKIEEPTVSVVALRKTQESGTRIASLFYISGESQILTLLCYVLFIFAESFTGYYIMYNIAMILAFCSNQNIILNTCALQQ